MKTMIPAAAGTYLLVPFLELGTDDLHYEKTRVPILGWANYSATASEPAGTRTAATPITPFWPDGVSQAAGYLIPDDQGGFTIAVPFAKRMFKGANAMAQYDHFAEQVVRGMEEEKNQEDAISGEMAQSREAPDEGDFITLKMEHGVYRVTPAEDTREVGTTSTGGARRSKEEIAADELFLEIVKGLDKTIRAVNTRWKTTPSRTAILADLAGIKPVDPQADAVGEEEDEDLIG